MEAQRLARAEQVAAQATDPDDREMVARIRAGDTQAFDTLVLTYGPPLRSFIQGLVGSPASAEELVQDVFLNIWRRREEWQVTSLRGYLYRAARNGALLYCRRIRINERWEQRALAQAEAPAMGTGGVPVDAQMEASEFGAALRQAIAQLPARCQQVAVLRFHHDLSHAEIAAAMGITVKAVEHQTTRALKALRAALAAYL